MEENKENQEEEEKKEITYQLPLTTYHLPLTTYHLQHTTYHLPFITYHLGSSIIYHKTFNFLLKPRERMDDTKTNKLT